MKILVALSGGVDSSVVACLLKQQGHEVIGVRFALWSDPLAPALARVLPTKCCDSQSLMRARAVCSHLKIPFHTVNLQKEFKCAVVDPYLAASRRGLTPNPCVLCNRIFKLRHLLALSKKLKCDKVATGHYARIAKRQGKYALLEAKDRTKDQSYFLSRLTQKELKKTLLPLGNLTKKHVYALAMKYRIPLVRATYRESQDLCFFPEKSPAAFLHRYIRDARPGPIKTLDGTIVGTHGGLPFVTVGQRRGLAIGGQREPHYIVSKEQKSNTIFVAPLRESLQSAIHIKRLSFTGESPSLNRSIRLQARIRSQGEKRWGTFTWNGLNGCFIFDSPTPAVTPGQACVLYRGAEILGSGIIAPFSRILP
ncbi:MAG: tRNA 2-thiouridine(34) synthase MnmA [Candidatus Peregrinibacteria bacterium]